MKAVASAESASDAFLCVGAPLKLGLTLGGHKCVYGTTLLGWKDHAWLVCEWPLQLGHDAAIPAGTACLVSYHHRDGLVGYRSEIRDLVTVPVPLLFLAYPQAVETMDLRKHARVSWSEPVLLERADPGRGRQGQIAPPEMVGGMLRDLSLGGCSVALTQSHAWIRPGVALHMAFELAGLGHVTNLTGIVKTADICDAGCVLGIQFRFQQMEYIEYRGWGGSVQKAIQQWTAQKIPARARA